jgi:hypothetical protein
MVVSMEMAVFWVVALCSLVALMMEAARTTETLLNFYQTTRRYNPEDSHLKNLCHPCERHMNVLVLNMKNLVCCILNLSVRLKGYVVSILNLRGHTHEHNIMLM